MYISYAIHLAFVAISVVVNSGAAEGSPTRRRKLLKGGDRFLRKDLKPKPTVSEYCISEGSVEMLIHALSIFSLHRCRRMLVCRRTLVC
jgi:hypothetical protein